MSTVHKTQQGLPAWLWKTAAVVFECLAIYAFAIAGNCNFALPWTRLAAERLPWTPQSVHPPGKPLFIGEFGMVNMFPQNTRFNNSAWKRMENEWADSIKLGLNVSVSIKLIGGSRLRPNTIMVNWQYIDPISKKKSYENAKPFKNEEFQGFDRLTKEEIAQL